MCCLLFCISIGGLTLKKINKLCQYDSPPSKDVTIDGVVVSIRDPATPTQSCPYDSGYFNNVDKPAILTGNNELLSFGIFFERSTLQGDGNNFGTLEEYPSKTRPVGDSKFIEVADTGSSICVLSDAFNTVATSSLGWNGTIIQGKRAFHPGSTATINDNSIAPCYTYEVSPTSGDYTLLSNVDGLSVNDISQLSTSLAWISDSLDFFAQCFDMLNEPTPLMAFIAMTDNVTDVYDADAYGDCVSVLEQTYSELAGSFRSNEGLFTITLSETQRGSFIMANSEMDFVVDSHKELFKHRTLQTLDRNTRTFRIYALAKNANKRQRFYSMTHITFTIDASGKISLDFRVDNIPIVHYQYGFERTAIEDYTVIALECTFAFMFMLYCFREMFQLRYRGLRIARFAVEFLESRDILVGSMTSQRKIIPLDEEARSLSENPASSKVRFSENEVDGDSEPNVENSPSVEESQKKSGSSMAQSDVECGLGDFSPAITVRDRLNMLEANDDETRENATEEQRNAPVVGLSPDLNPMYDILDWVTIICVVLCISYRVNYVLLARDFHNYGSKLTGKSLLYEDKFQSIIDQFAALEHTHMVYLQVAAFTVFIGVCQFFRYISFDRQLAIVTSTVYNSITSLLPVLLVFFIVLVCYGAVGSCMFGSSLPQWATFSKSLSSLFFFVLGEIGAYDESKFEFVLRITLWNENCGLVCAVKQVSPLGTPVFFWSFIVVVLFILFNMVSRVEL